MLQHLLELLAAGRGGTPAELARALDVPEELLAAMLEDLERRGLLATVDGCAGACGGCGVAACVATARGRAFALTEAGRAASGRRS